MYRLKNQGKQGIFCCKVVYFGMFFSYTFSQNSARSRICDKEHVGKYSVVTACMVDVYCDIKLTERHVVSAATLHGGLVG